MLNKAISLVAIGGLSLSLGACTNEQEQQVITDIQDVCQLLPIGTVFTVAFTSSIPLTSPLSPIIQTIGTTADADCNSLATAVQNVINTINGAGGTATVNMTSSSAPAAASLKALGKKLSAKYHLKAVQTAKGVTFVVPPAPLLPF